MSFVEPTSVDCVIYHADCTDGFGAAYAAWKQLGNRAEYHACKHGTKPPDVKGKTVAILDFSFNNATTKKMIDAVKLFEDGKIEKIDLIESASWALDPEEAISVAMMIAEIGKFKKR